MRQGRKATVNWVLSASMVVMVSISLVMSRALGHRVLFSDAESGDVRRSPVFMQPADGSNLNGVHAGVHELSTRELSAPLLPIEMRIVESSTDSRNLTSSE
jgi:hypothetical protein